MPNKTYARIDTDYRVIEIFQLDAKIDIHNAFHSSVVDTLVDITNVTPVPEVGWLYDSGTFIQPPPANLEVMRLMISRTLESAYYKELDLGFYSNATGTRLHYTTQDIGDEALSVGYVRSISPGLPGGWTTLLPVIPVDGLYDFVSHNSAQMQQVGAEYADFLVVKQTKLSGYMTRVKAATTQEAIASVVWEEEIPGLSSLNLNNFITSSPFTGKPTMVVKRALIASSLATDSLDIGHPKLN